MTSEPPRAGAQPAPLILSSGDPAIDRRLEWAQALLAEGNATDAAELMTEAVARAPGFVSGWFVLAEARAAAGDSEAAAAYAQALKLDPDDRLGAGPRLARLGGQGAGLSPAYVRTLFDQYAGRFDGALEKLGYRGPALIREALRAACARLGQPARFQRALDLGCGTGLVGVALSAEVARIDGVDLSPNMVAQARARGFYTELAADDMLGWLCGQPDGVADLVVAGDVFCYLDDLGPTFRETRRVLGVTAPTALTLHLTAPTGQPDTVRVRRAVTSEIPSVLFAFTVETHAGEGVILRDTLRYAHGEAYVRQALAEAGLEIVSIEPAATRTEKGQPVPGLVVVAAKG